MSSLALGSPIRFDQSANVNQYAFFVQDNIKFGDFQVQAGLRVGHYHGIVSDTSAQPRIGFSYLIKPTGTVLRASYSRTFETPYNENLILSSATGVGGLASNVFGAVGEPLPGNRNQYNAGIEQAFGRWLVASADYFWKYTNNAYDFGVLFNTPIAFPIAWNKSKLDGVAVRIRTPNLHGFQWTTTMGHTRARYFPPETGGLVFNGDVGEGGSGSASITTRLSSRPPSCGIRSERLVRGSPGPGDMTAAWWPVRSVVWKMRWR